MQYNTQQWNATLYGGSGLTQEVYSSNFLVFNGLSLSDNVNVVCEDFRESMAEREMDVSSVPLADGVHINSLYERATILRSRHRVIQDDAEALEAYLDTVKRSIAAQEGNLDITRNGEARRYIATLKNPEAILESREKWDVSMAPLELEWLCHEGSSADRAYTILSDSFTASPDTMILDNQGTANARPVFVIVFNTATDITACKIGNDTTGEQIQYTGTLEAGDSLVIDSEEQTVTLNGTAVSFLGSLPLLAVGVNTIRLTVTGTSFATAVTVKWKRRWR